MSNEFLDKITQLQGEYYQKNGGKNTLFKKTQKAECATAITEQVGLEAFLQHLIYYIPEKNVVYIDYTVFKTFAHPSNYEIISNYMLEVISSIIITYGEYTMMVNMDSITVSGVERYKEFILLFMNIINRRYEETNVLYSSYIKINVILNAPNVFQQLIMPMVKPFLEDDVVAKMKVVVKADTQAVIDEYFG